MCIMPLGGVIIMLITITGPSGSGKSTISNYLCSLNKNIVHLNIDSVGHKALEMPNIKKRISKKLGLQLKDGKINRKELGDLIFNNHEKMKVLSDLIWKDMECQIDNFIDENKDKIIVLDWILIPKTKYFNISDINILVQSDFNSRMNRAIVRDSIDEKKFKEREQATLDFTKNQFHFIIQNDDLEQTRKRVKEMYDESIIFW